MPKAKPKSRKPKNGPLSLHPLTLDQAVSKMFATKAKTPKRKR